MTQNELDRALINAAKTLDRASVRQLLEAGADPNAQEIFDKDPDYLLPDPSVIDFVIDSAAQYHQDCQVLPEQLEQIVQDLVDHGARPKGTRYNEMLLIFAAINALCPIVSLLLEYGVDPNIRRSNGDLAIHYAVSNCDLLTVQALVTHGSELNGLDIYGRSPRYIALKEKKVDIADYLRDMGGELIPDPKEPLACRPGDIYLVSNALEN